MTSKTEIKATKSGSFFKRFIKGLNDLLLPILYVPAVICAILSCFRPLEGRNEHTVYVAIAVVSFVIIIAVKLFNGYFSRKDTRYHAYKLKIADILDLSNLLPLLLLTVIVAFPFYLLAITSMKNPIEANSFQFTWWPEQGIDLTSFKELFQYDQIMGISMVRSIINSFVYALIPTAIGLFTSAISAYAFSKLRFRGSTKMYDLLIATMMMPGCVTMATGYMLYDWYGWTNSPLPLIIPALFGGASTVMFLREFFMGVPDGLLEAAEIDGAGRWRRFFFILIPLAKPALIAQFILGFISSFNDYMGPLIYLNKTDDYTIQIFLNFLNENVLDNSLIATAGVFSLVPMLLLYTLFQKPILNGISISSGLKG